MKKNKSNFPALLEQVLANIWGINKDRLDKRHLVQTRKSLSDIRAVYRHKGERGIPQPSRINYSFKKNRAGYLAAFGERHAYLSFIHLKKIQALSPESMPQTRGRKNELVVTSLGAGASIELYGVCLYYLKGYQRPLYLRLNSIEKESEWTSNRHIVFNRVLKTTFPKLEIDPVDIIVDLRENAIPTFASYYDRLTDTDILLIYNVMNEIPTIYTRRVWKNVKFLLNNFQKPTLILLMEPSAERAEPRIHLIKTLLAEETDVLDSKKEETFYFDTLPVCIEMDDSEECLNYRLFSAKIDGPPPSFETRIQRSHMACVKKPDSPISMEQIARQLSSLERKRGRKGAFLARYRLDRRQHTFADIDDQWE